MASLKDLRSRIDSVKSTQKITKAMKMVAASKLRRAEENAAAARPYAVRMEKVLASLAGNLVGADGGPRMLVGTGKDDVHMLVVATAERGLCGGFNTSIVKAVRLKIDELQAQGKTVKLLIVGKKGRDALKREHKDKFIADFDLSHVKRLAFDDAEPIAQKVLELFDAGEFDVCTIFYNKFVSVLQQDVTAQQLIPAALPEAEEEVETTEVKAAYEYEPEESEILETLLPANLSIQVFGALLENAASEQGARMGAMDNATRNAGDMIDRLSIQYNRSRQAAITTELTEIVAGAEAV